MAWFRCKFHQSKYQYFPMKQNDNTKFSASDITALENLIDATNYYYFMWWGGYSGNNNRFKQAYVVSYAKSSNGTIKCNLNSNLYQFSLKKVGGSFTSTIKVYQYDTQRLQYWYLQSQYSGDGMSYSQNLISSKYSTDKDYVSNFKLVNDDNDTILQYP